MGSDKTVGVLGARHPSADDYDWWANTTHYQIKARRAVIEAAKACVQELRTMEPRPVRDRYLSYQVDSWDQLVAAVDALATPAATEKAEE